MQAGRLGNERHRTRGARVYFQHVHLIVFDGELHVHQTTDIQCLRHRLGLATQFFLNCLAQRIRRQRTGRVARVHARLFDVFHDTADNHFLTIRQRVDVDFTGVVEEAVEQDRRIIRNFNGLAHVALEILLLVHNFHGAPTQHIRRTHDQRITDFFGHTQRFFFGARGTVRRLFQAQIVQQLLESFTVFGRIDHIRRRTNDRHAVGFQRQRQLQRRLATILHNHTHRLFDGNDFQHVFQRQRFEVQSIRGVVVG